MFVKCDVLWSCARLSDCPWAKSTLVKNELDLMILCGESVEFEFIIDLGKMLRVVFFLESGCARV